jgi:hypothetical protein
MNLAFWKKKSQEIKPYFEKERYPCPFYGFFGGLGIMMDQEGNQCALIRDSYSPCPLKMNDDIPDYKKCSPEEYEKYIQDNSDTGLRKLSENVRVFPKEFHPPEVREWEGISLRQWMDYILKR